MRASSLLVGFSIVLLWSTDSCGIYLTSSTNALPFDVTLTQGSPEGFTSTVQISNESDWPVTVLAWQLSLQIQPLPGALGQVLFESVVLPADSLFGEASSLESDLIAPADHILVFDADVLTLSGVSLAAQGSQNALRITLSADPQALGSFEVVTPAFDPIQPDLGSSWLNSDFLPQPFANSQLSTIPGFIRLGSVRIVSGTMLGDYNRDNSVDSLDYQLWLSQFGRSVDASGDGADGNHDGIVDTADFVIWRNSSNAALSQWFAVPEPSPMTSGLVAWLYLSMWCRSRSQAPRSNRRSDDRES